MTTATVTLATWYNPTMSLTRNENTRDHSSMRWWIPWTCVKRRYTNKYLIFKIVFQKYSRNQHVFIWHKNKTAFNISLYAVSCVQTLQTIVNRKDCQLEWTQPASRFYQSQHHAQTKRNMQLHKWIWMHVHIYAFIYTQNECVNTFLHLYPSFNSISISMHLHILIQLTHLSA